MNELLYREIVATAQRRGLTTYTDISPLVGLSMEDEDDREEMSRLLGEIARHEQAANRPMLTAVVVHWGNDNNPVKGFSVLLPSSEDSMVPAIHFGGLNSGLVK